MANADFHIVADRALNQIEGLLASWLPNGIRDGVEYRIGSKYGEEGRSMSIRLTGDKAGCWSDFAAGDSGKDLISLYAYINNLQQGEAMREIAGQIGIDLQDNRVAPAPAGDKAKPRTEWIPVLPVPDDAPPYPKAHEKRGRPVATWGYRDNDGRFLGIVCRFRTSNGGKEVLPCVFAVHPTTKARMWRWISFREPRPLYLPMPLTSGNPVIVVEGEKCADALNGIKLKAGSESFDVVSWPGGSKAVAKADWTPLAGRQVILWADADAKTYPKNHPDAGHIMPEHKQPGMASMLSLSKILRKQGCRVRFIDIPKPGEMPDGWDVADLVDGGASREDVGRYLIRFRPDDFGKEDGPEKADVPHEEAGAAPDEKQRKRVLRARLIPTSNGGIKGCRENVYMVMEDDPYLKGLVGLDEFSQLQIKLKNPPWKSTDGEWTESDDFNLGMYLAQNYGLIISSIGDIERAVAQSAKDHAFNSVTDYMDICVEKWDGIPRIERAFIDYWGSKDDPYVRLISRMFFIGMAKRAYFPGCKHDCAPVFEGGQGAGKSTALSIIGGDWFADTAFKMGDKDGFMTIQGILLYEIAELEQFNRSEVTEIKGFMSSIVDRYREPYGRRLKKVPRRTVFAGTTNEGEYFKDTTGNRRFWPVMVNTIDIDSLRRDRDQLIGEAVHLMRSGERWYPTKEEQRILIDPEQAHREILDPWIHRIYNYLEGLGPDGVPLPRGKADRVTTLELLTNALNIEIGRIGPAKQEVMRIAACMRKLNWVKGRDGTGARERFYTRPKEEKTEKKEIRDDDDDLPI